MKKFLQIFILINVLIGTTACFRNKGADSGLFMSRDSVVMILEDLYLADAIRVSGQYPDSLARKYYIMYFTVNGIEEARFRESLVYYYKNEPEVLVTEINKAVVDSLTNEQKRIAE